MPLDLRLREGLERSSSSIEEHDIELLLSEIATQAHHRRMARRAMTGAIVVAALLVMILLAWGALDAVRSADRRIPAGPRGIGIITTIAGTGIRGSTGDGGPAAEAQISYPVDLAVDDSGNLYILEYHVARIRRVDPTGSISTVMGPPAGGAPAPGEAGRLETKVGATALAIDHGGSLYFGGEPGSRNVVVRIDPRSGVVERVAGSSRRGYSGDGGPATGAGIGWVYDIAVGADGTVYLVDHTHNVVRRVDTEGVITTIAGTGRRGYSGDGGPAVEADLDRPNGLFVDHEGNVYVADAGNHRVRRIDRDGNITTVAGTGKPGYSGDGGPATRARLDNPEHVWVDLDGNVFIEDTASRVIRMIDAGGIITTVAGSGLPGYRGDGGPAGLARLREPSGMTMDTDGTLYIADSGNHRVRKVLLP